MNNPAANQRQPAGTKHRSHIAINNDLISPLAQKVITNLHKNNFMAYLVGGGVRDLLMNTEPKDFDVVTNASADTLLKLFRRSRKIGRRFPLVHVFDREETIEITSFQTTRQDNSASTCKDPDALKNDAMRRDFTINALYYDPHSRQVFDFFDGLNDLTDKRLRFIGPADQRIQEDPVRMIRALRFMTSLNLVVDRKILHRIKEYAGLIREIPPARLAGEMQKLMLSGHVSQAMPKLQEYGLFHHLFPLTPDNFPPEDAGQQFLKAVYKSSDKRVVAGKPAWVGFILAALLWQPMLAEMPTSTRKSRRKRGSALNTSINRMQNILKKQSMVVTITNHSQSNIINLWLLQNSLTRVKDKPNLSIIANPMFRAAFDFLQLREESGESTGEISKIWQPYYDSNPPKSRRSYLRRNYR